MDLMESMESAIGDESAQADQSTENQESFESGEQPKTDITDLDSLEKFKFEGKEWTPQELRDAYLMQSDYTKKTQELAEDRKFYDNLYYDLQKVAQDPRLESAFRTTYPEKFHRYLESVERRDQPAESRQSEDTVRRDPELENRLSQLEQRLEAEEVAKIEKEMESTFVELKGKYPLVDESHAIAIAQGYLDKNENLDKGAWEQIFKQINDQMSSRFDAYQKERVEKQKSAHKQGADSPAGGGIPSRGPKKFKNLHEATEAYLASDEAGYN